MRTAEWICTRCGATNRLLVAEDATAAEDRCLSCHRLHHLTRDTRPVRWRASRDA